MRPPALSLHRPLANARARILAFPHAGGGASAFIKLRAALSVHGIELCALQAPGRENRSAEPHHATVEAMAREFAAAIATLPGLPTALLGHSFGGLAAYLTARLLTDMGLAPDHVVVSGSLAPVLPRGFAAASREGSFRDRIIALGGIPDAILADPELFAMFEAVIRADISLGDAYRHGVTDPLPCPITVYSGTRDKAAPPRLASAWQQLSAGELRLRSFDGGHFFLYAEPDHIAATLLEDIGWGLRVAA